MSKDLKVSSIQIRGLIVSSVIGVQVLTLPNTLSNIMGKDGWIAILLAGLLMIPIVIVINKIFEINPNKDFFQIGRDSLGSVGFTLCLLIYLVYFIIFTAYISRTLGELIKAFLLPTTPIEFIIITFILACSYIALYEIDSIVRAGYFIYPVIIGFVLLLVLVSIPTMKFTDVLPVFQSDLTQIPRGIQTAFLSYAGFELMLFALPYVEKGERDKTLKAGVLSIIIVTIIYLGMFIISITHFSLEQIQRQTYPILMLAKLIDLPGYFLQNLDGIFMAIWVLVVFATMSPAYFASGKILGKMFKLEKHKYFIWGLIPVIYFISLHPENIVVLDETLGKYVNILGFISIVTIPFLILIVGSIRKRLKK